MFYAGAVQAEDIYRSPPLRGQPGARYGMERVAGQSPALRSPTMRIEAMSRTKVRMLSRTSLGSMSASMRARALKSEVLL